jgi:WD40 repeat protein
MIRNLLMAAGLVAVAACGDGLPEPARHGPRVSAALEQEWDLGGSPARQAVFSADGRLLATSSAGGAILIRRAADWKILLHLDHPGGVASLAFSPDGKRLFSGGYDGAVRSWNPESGHETLPVRKAQGAIWSLDVSPDGSRLAAAGEDRLIRLWPLAGGPSRVLAGHERNIWEVRFSPDGRRLASGSFDATARLWSGWGKGPVRILRGHDEAVVGLDYSPDGRLLATGGDDSTIRLWRTTDGSPLMTIDNGNHAYKLAFNPDGRWLASAGRARGGLGTLWHQATGAGAAAAPVHVWRVSDGALIAKLPHPDDVMYVTFSPDGRRLVTGGEDGKVRIWRLTAQAGRD